MLACFVKALQNVDDQKLFNVLGYIRNPGQQNKHHMSSDQNLGYISYIGVLISNHKDPYFNQHYGMS